jgi:hypothetical protein
VYVTLVNPALYVGLSLAGGHAVSILANPQARHRHQAVLPDEHQPTLVVTFRDPTDRADRAAPLPSQAVRFPLRDARHPVLASAPIRFFGGQSDPADARRFTIDFQTAGHRGRMAFTLGRRGVVARQMEYPLA